MIKNPKIREARKAISQALVGEGIDDGTDMRKLLISTHWMLHKIGTVLELMKSDPYKDGYSKEEKKKIHKLAYRILSLVEEKYLLEDDTKEV